jgi:hypothetical protein
VTSLFSELVTSFLLTAYVHNRPLKSVLKIFVRTGLDLLGHNDDIGVGVQLPHALAVDQVKAPDGVNIDSRFSGVDLDVHAGDTWVVKVQEVVVGDLQRQGNRMVRELQPAAKRLLSKRSAFISPYEERELWNSKQGN